MNENWKRRLAGSLCAGSAAGLVALPFVVFGVSRPAAEILDDHRALVAHDWGRDADGSPKGSGVLIARHSILYRAILFRGDDVILTFGAESEAELRVLLRDAIIRHSPTDVAVFDYQILGGVWWHPDGKVMPEAWDGRLPAKVEIKLGSAGL